jgi:hypothetical protein
MDANEKTSISSQTKSLPEDTELLFYIEADVYSIVLQRGYSNTNDERTLVLLGVDPTTVAMIGEAAQEVCP